jgi:hypothetical protein
MKNYKYYYVYRITNILHNKHYYGYRSSDIEPILDIGVKYFSSSKDRDFIKDQIQNPHNYKYVIVCIFDNREDAHNLEIKLHAKFNVGSNPSFYNKANATSSKFSITGTTLSEETKKKMSQSRKGRIVTQETRDKISIANAGTKHDDAFKDAIRKRMLGNTNNIGKNHSEASKLKMSKSLKGKQPWNKGLNTPDDVKIKQSLSKLNMTQEQKNKMHSWKKGRPCPDNVKLKLSKPQTKIQCPHCKKIGGISAMKQNHFDRCKLVDNPEK